MHMAVLPQLVLPQHLLAMMLLMNMALHWALLSAQVAMLV
jgi:hypothetical protein